MVNAMDELPTAVGKPLATFTPPKIFFKFFEAIVIYKFI